MIMNREKASSFRSKRMREKSLPVRLLLMLLLVVPALALSQAQQQTQTLFIEGKSGEATVVQINGRSYVDLEALARVVNGSLSFNGNRITLTLPTSSANNATAAPAASPTANSGLSKEFMKAGIEEMSAIREWRSALGNAVQNGYPVTEEWVGAYRGQAATSLRLASVAVSTDSDGSAYQLISNVFDNMQQLSNKFVAARKSLNYMAPDSLKNDPLNQKILNCARSLASMAASGQFVDDGSCH
jgi:hypothetical protein